MEIWALRNNSNEPTEMLKQAKFDSRIDTDLLVGKIIEVCGNMTPVHNTTDSFLYFHKLFFKMWEKQISKLLDTMDYEYEPLENYRRAERLTLNANENITGSNSTNGSNTNDESSTTKDTYKDSNKSNSSSNSSGNESSSSSDSSTAEEKTSAYNESVYQPESQTTKKGSANGNKNSSAESSSNENSESSSEDSRQSTNTYSRTNQQNSNYTKGTTNGKTEDNTIRGLNGLFTTQQLIKQEREIAEFNVYQWIVTKYMEELFICVF